MNLQLDRVELREIELPLKAPFETSFGRVTRRRILLVKVFDRRGMAGYGECVAMEHPFYNHETIDTAWLMTTKYIVPLLEAAQDSVGGAGARRACPDSGKPDGEGGGRSGHLGSRSEAGRTALVAIYRGHAGRNQVRRVDRLAGIDRGASRQGQPGDRVRLSEDQAQDQTWEGRRSSLKPSVRSFRTSHSRSTPILHTRSCPTLRSSRDWTTSAC